MLKLLKILVMLLVADVVAYFFLGKIGNEDDPKNYVVLNPYALPELSDKVLDEQILNELGVAFIAGWWIRYGSSPLLYYWTDFTKNLEEFFPKTTFDVISFDSLDSEKKEMVAQASFDLENGKIVKYSVEMTHGRHNKCLFKYNDNLEKFSSSCKDNYAMVEDEKGETFHPSDSLVNRRSKDSHGLDYQTLYFDDGEENRLGESVYQYDSAGGKLTRLLESHIGSDIKEFFFQYNEDGRLKRIYKKGKIFDHNIVEVEYDRDSKKEIRRIKDGGLNQIVYMDSSNVDSVRVSVVNTFSNGEKDSFDIVQVNHGTLELIKSSTDDSLARVEHLTEGNVQRDLFLTESLDTLGWIVRQDGVLLEMGAALNNCIFESTKKGFRVVRFITKSKDVLNIIPAEPTCRLTASEMVSIKWDQETHLAKFNDVVLRLDKEKFFMENHAGHWDDGDYDTEVLRFSNDRKYVKLGTKSNRYGESAPSDFTYYLVDSDTLRICVIPSQKDFSELLQELSESVNKLEPSLVK